MIVVSASFCGSEKISRQDSIMTNETRFLRSVVYCIRDDSIRKQGIEGEFRNEFSVRDSIRK